MKAPQLTQRVTFQQRAADANGDRLGAWEDGFTIAAAVLARVASKGSAAEPVLQARLRGVQPIEVTIRSTTRSRTIDSAWRVLWNGQPCNVKAVAPSSARRWLRILAEAEGSNE